MAGPTKLVAAGDVRSLGTSEPVVAIGESPKADGQWMGARHLTVAGGAAFELSYWCGTCPFLFKRLEGANETLSQEALQAVLNVGLDDIDDSTVGGFGSLLTEGEYLPLLLEIEPTLVLPMGEGDYFSSEQVATWGIAPFWGLPQYPQTPYYRGDARALTGDNRLFEFVVPMAPPTWNDRARVEEYDARLRESSTPTCVALGLLDVRQRAVATTPEGRLIHWGLTHFLLDGHHKLEAAARTGRRLRLLSLVSVDDSLAEREAVESLGQVFGSERS